MSSSIIHCQCRQIVAGSSPRERCSFARYLDGLCRAPHHHAARVPDVGTHHFVASSAVCRVYQPQLRSSHVCLWRLPRLRCCWSGRRLENIVHVLLVVDGNQEQGAQGSACSLAPSYRGLMNCGHTLMDSLHEQGINDVLTMEGKRTIDDLRQLAGAIDIKFSDSSTSFLLANIGSLFLFSLNTSFKFKELRAQVYESHPSMSIKHCKGRYISELISIVLNVFQIMMISSNR